MIIIDLLLISALAYSAYAGSKRGLALVSLELASFAIATTVALVAFHPAGAAIKSLAGLPAALSNVSGFILIWILTEIACAIIIRLTILRRLHPAGPPPHPARISRPSRVGGAFLNIIKTAVITTLGLIVFAALPLTADTKRLVTDSYLAKTLLSWSGRLQTGLATGLRHDLGESLNFFTVTAEPESEQRIDLGYTTTGTVNAAAEEAMLTLLNQERINRGLPPLTMNAKARTVARAYSSDMFARGYFSHINPEGKSPFDRMKTAGVRFGAAGENLALAPTLQLAHQGLMNSPGHRANILSAHYRTIGIGIVDGGPYGLMVTQDFTD